MHSTSLKQFLVTIRVLSRLFHFLMLVKEKLLSKIFFQLHGPSMFAVKAKIYGVLYNQHSSIALMSHLVIGQRQKAPNFSASH